MTEGARAEALSAVLAKLATYEGPVWRDAPLPSADADAYARGDVVHEPAFVSGTRDPAVSMPGSTTFVISSRAGKDISSLSTTPGDGEVVFDRDGLYLVLAVEQSRDMATVYLDELSRDVGPPDLATAGGGAQQLLARLRAAQDQRLAIEARDRRPVSTPGKYSFAVGMTDSGQLRRIAAGRG